MEMYTRLTLGGQRIARLGVAWRAAPTAMLKPIIICHQLRSPDNLGAIARVMANFGLEALILSDPQTHDFRGVERLGVKAGPVLERFAVAATLDEALAKAVYAVGTSSRTALKRFTPLSPEQGVARLARHAERGPVALVLGGEKRGLSDDELARCHDVIVIPTDAVQPSLNISHAAAVLAYLCARQGLAPAASAPVEGAPLALVHRLEARLQEVLLAADFLNPQAPQHVLRELSRSLVHGHLTRREAELWLAALEHLARAFRGPSGGGR
jgi:tRNA/rRNA methyltransferase